MIGYLFAFLYCIVTAFSVLKIHDSVQQASAMVVMFYTFIVCLLFFNLVNFFALKKTYQALKTNLPDVLLVNLTTALTWMATFWGLKYLPPVLYITITMGVLPIASFILAMWEVRHINKLACLLTVVATILIIFIVYLVKNLLVINIYDFTIGTLLSILTGIFISFYMKYSKRLHAKSNLSPSQILCIRFYLLVLIGLIVSLCKMDLAVFTRGIHLSSILLIVFSSSILPLYFVQISIHRIGPLKTAYILPFTPVFTYVLEWFLGMSFNALLFATIFILGVVLAYSATINTDS